MYYWKTPWNSTTKQLIDTAISQSGYQAIWLDEESSFVIDGVQFIVKDRDFNMRSNDIDRMNVYLSTDVGPLCTGWTYVSIRSPGQFKIIRVLSRLSSAPFIIINTFEDWIWGYYVYHKGRRIDQFSSRPAPVTLKSISCHQE